MIRYYQCESCRQIHTKPKSVYKCGNCKTVELCDCCYYAELYFKRICKGCYDINKAR